MITVIEATWAVRTPRGPRVLFDGVTACFGQGERVGILAAPGSGKSSLARMLCGIQPPDRGDVVAEGRVSWPLGFSGALHPELTGLQNIDIIARTLGEDTLEMAAFCTAFAGPEVPLERKVKYFAPTQRLALAFSLSMSVACDHYIADEVVGFGDGVTRARSTAMLEQRLERAGLVYISRNPSQLKRLCSRFMVLASGRLIDCPTPEIGAEVLKLAAERDGSSDGASRAAFSERFISEPEVQDV